jgi:penicillin G amidase
MGRWRYARAHRARFVHPVLTRETPPAVAADGDFSTVSVGSSRLPTGTTFAFGPAFRHLVDLSQPDSSLAVIPPGNSGDLRSPHARDMIDRWATHGYVPLYLSWPDAEQVKESVLTLAPGAR